MFRVALNIVIATHILHHARGVGIFGYVSLMKEKVLGMEEALTVDSKAKVRAILYIRDYYSNSIVYHVAKTTCRIRQRYARLMFLYMIALENYDRMPVGGHIKILIEMQQIWWYIDNLVQMIELWAEQESAKERQVNLEKQQNQKKERYDKLKWQVQKDTQKIVRQREEKDSETNKYMNGFDTDFVKR